MTIVEWAREELIKQQEFDAEILEVFATGSQILKKNPNDLDFIVIAEDFYQRRRKVIFEDNGINFDVTFVDIKAVKAQLDLNENYYTTYPNIFNYFYNIRDTIYGGVDLGWNILDYKEDYFNYLKSSYKEQTSKILYKWKHGKVFVHYYIPLKMFENNSTELTAEMKADIEKLYSNTEEALTVIGWVENILAPEE